MAPDFRDDYEQSLRKKAAKEESGDQPAAAPDKKDGGKKQGGGGAANHGVVWVQDGAFVRPIKLQTGLTDGVMTEVVRPSDGDLHKDDALDVGTALVTGENAAHAAAATNNPFQMKLVREAEEETGTGSNRRGDERQCTPHGCRVRGTLRLVVRQENRPWN